jgi:hypothetical protein
LRIWGLNKVVNKYLLKTQPRHIANALKKMRIDMLEYELKSLRPHPAVVFGQVSRILESMNVAVDDNTMDKGPQNNDNQE